MPTRHSLTLAEILTEEREDAELRAYWERTAPARAVANWVVAYRAAHGLSQSQIARTLGGPQPQVTRLEAGEHVPSLATLLRLARMLGLRFRLEVAPPEEARCALPPSEEMRFEETATLDGARVLTVVAE